MQAKMATSRNVLITAVENFSTDPPKTVQHRKKRKHKPSPLRSPLATYHGSNPNLLKPPTVLNYTLSTRFTPSSSSQRLFTGLPTVVSTPASRNTFWGQTLLSYRTEEENRIIKKKLEEYDQIYNKRNSIECLLQNRHASYEELNEKFNAISFQINSLLAAESPVKPLAVMQEEKIELAAGLKCHYKVLAKGRPTPLKIRIAIHKGKSHTYLSISHRVERPNKDHCEKAFLISAKEQYLSYYGERENEKEFAENSLYLTLECNKECSATLAVGFGNARFYQNIDKTDEELSEAAESALSPTVSEKDKTGKKAELRKLTQRCNAFSRTIYTKFLRKKPVDEILRIRKHRKNVLLLRELKEEKELSKKFLLTHRKEINKQYELLTERKAQEIKMFKKKVKSWVNILKVSKLVYGIYNKYLTAKKKHEERQDRLYSGLKIRIFLRSKLYSSGQGFKERIGQGMAAGVVALHNQQKDAAFRRSVELIFELLKAHQGENLFLKKATRYINKVKTIQIQWKYNMRLEKAKKAALKEQWENELKDTINEYKRAGKRYHSLVYQLEKIDTKTRDRVLNAYYKENKKRYIDKLRKWFESRKGLDKTAIKVINKFSTRPSNNLEGALATIQEEQSSAQKMTKSVTTVNDIKRGIANTIIRRLTSKRLVIPETKKELDSARKPVFHYKLAKDVLRGMILKAIETSF